MSFCAQPWLVHVPELNPISKEKNLQLLRNLILIQDHGKDHNMDLGKDHKFSTIFHTTQRFNYYNMQKNSHQFGKKDLTSLFLFRFSLNGNIKPIPPPLISVDTSHSISSSSECGIPAVYGKINFRKLILEKTISIKKIGFIFIFRPTSTFEAE